MTRRYRRQAATFLAALLLAAGLASCARRLGWGVVLWSSAEGPLPAGSLVPVYIKSNIQSLYVVGLPGGDKKVELPLWQMELFPTKAKAAARLAAFGEYLPLYMVANRDGVLVRKEPTNTVKQVYRLREGETVKVLRKVKGEAVSTGGVPLPGDWYEILAEGGEVGFVFSYAMRIYDEGKEGPPSLAAKPAASTQVDIVFSSSWKPAYFQEMIDEQRLDLDLFSLRFGLFTDATRRQVRIELPGVSEVFNYGTISEEGGALAFSDTPLRIKLAGERRLEVSWVQRELVAEREPANAAAAAAPRAGAGPAGPALGYGGRASFVALSIEPRELIRVEELRRQKLLEAFVAETGGSWIVTAEPAEPEAAGAEVGAEAAAIPAAPAGAPAPSALRIAKSRRFSWTGREALPEGMISPELGSAGEVEFRLYLDPALAAAGTWKGSFSLRFDPKAEGAERERVDLLYRGTETGIALALPLLGEAASGTGGFPGVLAAGPDPRFPQILLDREER